MERLIRRARRGDRGALRELLFAQGTLVEAVVARFLWDAGTSEDVIQNVMLRATRTIGTFSGTCRFSTWLYRLVVNECMEANRRSARWRGRIDRGRDTAIFADLNAPDGLAEAIRREQHTVLRGYVAELPKGMREAFELYYGEGCSGAEAARRLGITVQALFVRLSDARSRLKRKLIERGITP